MQCFDDMLAVARKSKRMGSTAMYVNSQRDSNEFNTAQWQDIQSVKEKDGRCIEKRCGSDMSS